MKFTQSDVNNLQQIIQICGLISIDSFLIADGLLSGVNSDRTAAFINVDDIPVLPEGAKLGISKLKTFKDRLDIFKSDPNLSIEAKQKANGEVSDLIVSGSSAKVSYLKLSMMLK